jgi:hypothetical protein
MRAEIRRKLAMVVRALQFAEANPSTDASYIAVVAKLQDAVTRADVLAIQQRDGIVNEHTAVGLRDHLNSSQSAEQIPVQAHERRPTVFFRGSTSDPAGFAPRHG